MTTSAHHDSLQHNGNMRQGVDACTLPTAWFMLTFKPASAGCDCAKVSSRSAKQQKVTFESTSCTSSDLSCALKWKSLSVNSTATIAWTA